MGQETSPRTSSPIRAKREAGRGRGGGSWYLSLTAARGRPEKGVPAPGPRHTFLRSLAAWRTQGWFVFHPQKRLEPQQEGGPAWPGRAPGSPGQPWDAHTVLFTEGSPGQLGCPLRASPATSCSASRPGDAICRGSGSWPAAPAGRRGRMCQLGQAPGRRGGRGGGSPCRRSAAEPGGGRAKHNSGQGREGRARATAHPGFGVPAPASHHRFHGTGCCCHNRHGMAWCWAARLAAGKKSICSWSRRQHIFEGLARPRGSGSAVRRRGGSPRPSRGPALCAAPARRARPRHGRFWKRRALSCQTTETPPSPALSIVKALP